MSEQNVQILREMYRRFAREGVEGIVDLFDPEFEGVVAPSLSAEPDTYRGPDGVRRWWAAWDGSIEDLRLEPIAMTPVDDATVLVDAYLRGRGAGSGIDVEQRAVQVWRFRAGRMLRLDTYADVDEARRALGLAG